MSNDAPQVAAVRKQMERAEQEAARLTELKEVRAARWSATAQLDQAVSDWVLRGIPSGCVIEPIEDDAADRRAAEKGRDHRQRGRAVSSPEARACRRCAPGELGSVADFAGGGRCE